MLEPEEMKILKCVDETEEKPDIVRRTVFLPACTSPMRRNVAHGMSKRARQLIEPTNSINTFLDALVARRLPLLDPTEEVRIHGQEYDKIEPETTHRFRCDTERK